jgi:hypothetical protein
MSSEQAEAPIRALVHAIRTPDGKRRIGEDLHGFLREAGLDGADLENMASFGPSRVQAYRALVHNRITGTVKDFIPRSFARLGRDRMNQAVAEFLTECAMQSPYLRDIPREFVEWVTPRWNEDAAVPDYVPQLALHELARLDVKNHPEVEHKDTGEKIDLEKPIRVEASAVVYRYDYAVHKLPRDVEDRTEPQRTPTNLIAFRGPDDDTHYIDCAPWVASLMERLIAKKTLREALLGGLADVGMELNDDILGRTAGILADFSDQGLLWGAEPTG